MTSDCIRCDNPFEHPPGRFTVCPPCRLAVARAAKKRWKKEQGSIASDCGGPDENWLRRLCVKSAAEVGGMFGLSRDQVLLIERKAIRKLREQKHILEAARDEVLADGHHMDQSASLTPFDLIHFQMSVGEWWAEADHFSGLGKDSERKECALQIGAFQRKIAEYLGQFQVEALGGGPG